MCGGVHTHGRGLPAWEALAAMFFQRVRLLDSKLPAASVSRKGLWAGKGFGEGAEAQGCVTSVIRGDAQHALTLTRGCLNATPQV